MSAYIHAPTCEDHREFSSVHTPVCAHKQKTKPRAREQISGCAYIHMSVKAKTQNPKFNMLDALERAGIASKSAKAAIIDMPVKDARALARAQEPSGAIAEPKELISIGNYVLSDERTSLCVIAGEFEFDQNVVRALAQMRREAHEGVKPERTEEKVEHSSLVGEEIDALRKDRREKSKAKRALKREAEASESREHGGLGHALAWVFTFGNFGR